MFWTISSVFSWTFYNIRFWSTLSWPLYRNQFLTLCIEYLVFPFPEECLFSSTFLALFAKSTGQMHRLVSGIFILFLWSMSQLLCQFCAVWGPMASWYVLRLSMWCLQLCSSQLGLPRWSGVFCMNLLFPHSEDSLGFSTWLSHCLLCYTIWCGGSRKEVYGIWNLERLQNFV